MNKMVKAARESLQHWEEMVERIIWLMESKLLTCSPYWFWKMFTEKFIEITGTFWSAEYCSLCELYHDENCHKCPLEKIGYGCYHIDNPWPKLHCCGSFEIFIEIAETEMIPALKKAYEWARRVNGVL